jgi:hypothetical protein
MLQRPGPCPDQPPAFERFPPRHQDHAGFGQQIPPRDDPADRVRRTSLSGILQRSESAPQRADVNGPVRLPRPDSATPISTNGDAFAPRNPPVERQPPLGGTYDTRPPPFNTRPPAPPVRHYEKRDTLSHSPEIRRAVPNGLESRNFNGILNDGPSMGLAAQTMARQDSIQSQNSAFGDRYRPRPFSPFAPSVTSQASMPIDEYGRKGSDELGHRTIAALANDSRRGRYSPVPQAVQGAQAQTPVPEASQKAEQGRVFAGLGGLGSGPTSTPVGLSGSPFKDVSARLSEENLIKMSRSTSGVAKRSRKFDDDIRAESETGVVGKKGRKRTKYASSYKPEEPLRRGTPLSIPVQRNPSTLSHQAITHQRPEAQPAFKPRQTIKILSVINAAKRTKRRHLGTFKYDPILSNRDNSLNSGKFDVDLKPNMIPSFDQPHQVNCTYSVRVPELWLQEREARLIGQERFLWGTGIYADDSDIVAAAMHSGFLKSMPPEHADRAMLDLISREQNAKIEGLVGVPEQPLVPETGKDAIITCVVLPCLEEYPSSTRYGIKSRKWPEEANGAEHDGVSFAILKVEFVNECIEARRVGRTGKERRERLKKELEERKRGQERVKEMAEKYKKRVRKVARMQRSKNGDSARKEMAGKAAMNSLKAKMRLEEEKRQEKETGDGAAASQGGLLNGGLDVGQTPGEWLKQLETSAVDTDA